MKLSPCSRCGQNVFNAWTPGGQMLPLDPEPNERGNLVVNTNDRGIVSVRPAVRSDGNRPRYRCHFATCCASDEKFPVIKVLPDPVPSEEAAHVVGH